MPAHILASYQVTASTELPATDRYEHWLTPLLSDFQAAPPCARQQKNFQGQVTSLYTATSELHDMQSDSFHGSRSTRRIQHHPDDKLALLYVIKGQITSRYKDDTEHIAQPGEFVLFDSHRSNHVYFHQPHFVQVNLPRTYLQTLLSGNPPPSQISQAVTQSGLARLLALQLTQFRDLSLQLTPQEQLTLLHSTESLATAVLESTCQHGQLHDSNHRHGLYTAALQYIHMHLASHHLNSTRIAASLGCSRTTLYRAFSNQPLSLAAHIRELRLQALARLLQRPTGDQPIAQLAQHCGLHDAPNLSRLFRQRFGLTPQDFRTAHQNQLNVQAI